MSTSSAKDYETQAKDKRPEVHKPARYWKARRGRGNKGNSLDRVKSAPRRLDKLTWKAVQRGRPAFLCPVKPGRIAL